MKFAAALLFASLSRAQVGPSFNDSSNELINGQCRASTLLYARGATEKGNMGTFGGIFSSVIRAVLPGRVAVQGINYQALMMSGTAENGARASEIANATALFNLAATKCPNSTIFAVGWSLGTAVIRGAIKQLDDVVREKVGGVVLYGDTQYQVNEKGKIPLLPQSRYKVYCHPQDCGCNARNVSNVKNGEESPGQRVSFCSGAFKYDNEILPGAQFLSSRLDAINSGRSGPSVGFSPAIGASGGLGGSNSAAEPVST